MPPEHFWQILYRSVYEVAVWVVAPALVALTIWKYIG